MVRCDKPPESRQLTLFEPAKRDKTRLEKTTAALGPRETSREAAVRVDDQTQCGIALRLIQGAGERGCTIDEIAAATGWYPGSASARIDQLRRAGQILEKTGAKRQTRKGRWAIVFVAVGSNLERMGSHDRAKTDSA